MSWTHLSSGTRRAAKRHRCWYCSQRIEVGEVHGYRTGVSGGDLGSMRFHPECDDWAAANWSEDDWECPPDPGEFQRPMTAFDPCI